MGSSNLFKLLTRGRSPLDDISHVEPPIAVAEARVWSGGVTATGFSAAFDITRASSDVRLVVSTNSDLSSPVQTTSAVASTVMTGDNGFSYHACKLSVTGLTAGTTYYYGVKIDGSLAVSPIVYRVKTFPAANTPANVRLVFASCNNAAENVSVPVGRSIALDNPDLMIHMGDMDYDDPGNNTNIYIQNDRLTRRFRKLVHFNTMLKTVPIAYMYDNHDSSSAHGEWDVVYNLGTHAEVMTRTREHYDLCVPNYPYVEATNRRTATQAWNIGSRLRVAMLDTRSQRQYSGDTLLGNGTSPPGSWDQESWLKSDMLAAQAAGVKVYLMVTPTSWTGTDFTYWPSATYGAAQANLVSWMTANLTTMRPVIATGDLHYSGISDGAGMPGGFPVLMASPLWNLGGALQGPSFKVAGTIMEYNPPAKQSTYMVVDVVDNGSALRLDIAVKGSPIDAVTFAPTTLLTASLSF